MKDFSIYADLSDLPPDLINELNLDEDDQVDRRIIHIIDSVGGSASLNEIIIGYYRLFREVRKRKYITMRLYRLAKNGIIKSGSKKGFYKIIEAKQTTTSGE